MERDRFSNEDEIVRLRGRVHDAEGAIIALNWAEKETRRFREHYGPLVDELISTDKIADAVADRMDKQHSLRLTNLQRMVGSLAALAAVGAFVHSFF